MFGEHLCQHFHWRKVAETASRFWGSSSGAKRIFSETVLLNSNCRTKRLLPLGTTFVVQVLTCGFSGTSGNPRSRRGSLTMSRRGRRLQMGVLWRAYMVIHNESYGFRFHLEDQQGRLRSY